MSVSGPCEPHQNCRRKRMKEEVGMEKRRVRWGGRRGRGEGMEGMEERRERW